MIVISFFIGIISGFVYMNTNHLIISDKDLSNLYLIFLFTTLI